MTRQTQSTLYVPTLLDRSGTRHIIPMKDSAAYCGARGSQFFPHEYRAADLCQRCLQQYMRVVVDARMEGKGL